MIKLSESRLQTACLLFITAVLATCSAFWLRPVLVPLVVAIFVVSGITPILEFLEKSIASTRFTAAVIAFLVGALLINLLTASLWASLVDLKQNFNVYQDSYNELREELGVFVPSDQWEFFPNQRPKLKNRFNLNDESRLPEQRSEPSGAEESRPVEIEVSSSNADFEAADRAVPIDSNSNTENIQGAQADSVTIVDEDGIVSENQQLEATGPDFFPQERESLPMVNPAPWDEELQNEENVLDAMVRNTITRGFSDIAQAFLEIMSTSLIVLIYVFFLMLGVPTESSRPKILNDIDYQIRSYLSLKTVISLFTGLAFGIALWFFGIPMALAFGMMAFFLNFIPNIGPIIASLLPIPLIVLHPEANALWIVFVILITSGIQFVSGNVIEPRLMGKSSDLHPIVVLVALMFWGMLWGIVGMFLAVPITSGIRIALSEFEQTKGISEVMAGRWPKDFFGWQEADVTETAT